MSAPLLLISNIGKSYGSLRALDDVSIEIRSGTIHVILGENGAGKSTLMGILAGFVKPDSGEVMLDSDTLPLGQPMLAKKRGIEMVHQHFTLVPAFTVAENLALFRQGSLFMRLNPATAAAASLELGSTLGWNLNGNQKTTTLPVGSQQKIEILKALSADAKVLILDEPTAVLSPDEVNDLFEVLRKLKASGKTILLIAHKLGEVMRIADRVSVLRKGKLVAEAAIADVSEDQLAEWMVGGVPGALQKGAAATSSVRLSVRDLVVENDSGLAAVRGVSFEVTGGEILGIGGVDGNGQVELAQALALVRPAKSGAVRWNEQRLGPSVRLAYIPQDRQADGLALRMSVADNMLIGGLGSRGLKLGPLLVPKRVITWARGLANKFSVATPSVQEPAGSLSGGNQQKIVVARNLDQTPHLLVAVNPTRGLDIQATQFVHSQILEARDKGAAVILFSTDLDELAAIADLRMFMASGKLLERMEDALKAG